MTLALAFLGGLAAGALHFGGLWLSVRRLAGGAPLWTLAVSAALRLGLVLGALGWMLAAGRPLGELGLAGLGFVLARLAAIRLAPDGTGGG